MTHNLAELSILIVTWKGDDLLTNCLDSLRQACGDVAEIVVVDNADLDSTRRLVARYANARYVAAPENLGFAGGNNLGLPYCTRPYVLLLNNDTVVHEEPFTQLVQYLKDHPRVAVVQGKMRLVRFGDVLDECGSYLTSWGELYFRYFHAPLGMPVSSGPVFHAKGACLMFHRDILNELNGVLFYDHFHSYYEDVDFCHRVWLAGYEVHFVDTPPIDHLQGMTADKIGLQRVSTDNVRNRMFSFGTLFSRQGLVSVAFRNRLLWAIVRLRYCLAGDRPSLEPHRIAFRQIRAMRKTLSETRSRIQSQRKISDRELFAKVMVRVPFSYYWHSLRGDLIRFLEKSQWRI